MRKLTFIFACISIILLSTLSAQNKTITGKVLTSNDNEPVIGASVLLKGTSQGTITDSNGDFSLTISGNSKLLVFSYIGFKTLEVEAKPTMLVRLESKASELDEVMVVAYGTTTKKSFTGSAAIIKGDKLTKLQSSSITKSLEGTVSGVQISSSSGQPGSDAAIRIRGLGSISASQSPLIVVDGVPYEGSLNSISTQDIETLTILKDAAANSMYGARGSNGVIVITTKKGEKGLTKVSFESRLGINSRGVPSYNVITDAGEYYEMKWEAVRNSMVEGGMSYYQANNYASKELIPQFLGYNVFKGIANNQLVNPETGKLNPLAAQKKWNDNWLTEPFENGMRQEYNINMQGGTENTSAYMSAGYLNDKGYVVNSDFTRLNVRLKLEQKMSENFKMGANLSYVQTKTNSPVGLSGGSNYSNMFMFSQMIAPIYPVFSYDLGNGNPILTSSGDKSYDFGSNLIENGVASTNTRAYAAQQNPIYTQKEDISLSGNDNLSAHGFMEFKFLTDFKFTFNVAYDVFNSTYTSFSTPLAGDAIGIGYGSKVSQRFAALNTNQLINYTKKFGFHDINILVGHESKSDDNWYLEGGKKNYWDPYNPEFTNAGATTGLSSYTSEYRIEGFLSRAEYNFKDKYYGSVSLRRDGSSKFAPSVRWGNFWSVGGAWRVKEESFMTEIDAVSNFKIKSSYGTQGNDAISGSNLFLDQFTMVSDGTNALPVFSYRGSPNLTWEKSNNFNAGIELGLFNRINIITDFFVKETKDMIYARPLPPSGGSPNWKWDNQIDMKNTGFEAEVALNIIKNKNVNWDVTVAVTSYKNELTRLPADKDPTGYAAGSYWRKIGGSLYDFYLYENAGVETETGLPMWYKDDEDKTKVTTTVYSEATEYEIGKSAIPDFYGGLSSNLIAYGFDISIQTAFQLGGYVYDDVYSELMSGGTSGTNWNKDIFKRWTPATTSSEIPRVSEADQNTNAFSSRFLTDGSYFSLRNITIGYTIPRKHIAKYKIQNMRIYTVADNLWLLSARQGLDPRQSFSGATYSGTYSALRTTSIGLSVNF